MASGTTLGTAYIQIQPSSKGIKGSISKSLGGEASSAGTAAGSSIAGAIKKAIVAAGIGAAITKTLKSAISEGAALQQSYMGGLDTIYGDAADAAREYARQAAAAGISMNDYSEQAISFGAALRQAYGGDTMKAAEAANTAILDMADNAAKMGTPLESIQNAYQGFAKQNYTMLDNLKLGYGGTRSEMERLLADANKINAAHGKMTNYSIDNLGDVYDAIHVIQGELGLTGVAAEEASQTFSGSLNAMKAAGKNLLGALALGEDITPYLDNFTSSLNTFVFKNLIPMLGTIIKGLPKMLGQLIQSGVDTLLDQVTAHTSIGVTNMGKKITALIDFKAWIGDVIPKLFTLAGELLTVLASGISQNAPLAIASVTSLISTILEQASTFFFDTLVPTLVNLAGQLPDLLMQAVLNGMSIVTTLGPQILDNLATTLSGFASNLTGEKISTWASEAIPKLLESAKNMIVSLGQGLVENIPVIISAIGTLVGNIIDGLMNIDWLAVGKGLLDLIGSGISLAIDALIAIVTSVGSLILKAFGLDDLWQKVKDTVEKIKGFFNFKISLPKIPLPHFAVVPSGWKLGDLLKGIIPKLDISWNAEGGIMESPTLFGGGEAGPEAIVPLTPFWDRLERFAESMQGGVTINVYGSPGMNVNELASAVEQKIISSQKRRAAAWL